jgi:hypothetical protein
VFGADAPQSWHASDAADESSALSSDQCVIGGQRFFVRGCLDIPIIGAPDVFRWLVWVELTPQAFALMDAAWERPGRECDGPYPGRLDSDLPYDRVTVGLEVTLENRPIGERPQVFVRDAEHDLGREQREGISVQAARSRAEALLHASGPAW